MMKCIATFLRAAAAALTLSLVGLPAAMAGAGVSVEDGYVRAPVPGRNVSAGFFTLHNHTEASVTLVAVQADFAERAEIHSHTHSDGMMRMRKEESVSVEAGATLAFAPGGYHIMLFGLQEGIGVGDELDLTIVFDDGESLTVPVMVRSLSRQSHH
ncbi:copper chaperone PCu(A)C [Marinimicrobium alkaliphilum]|uniref:copper chaperone PCu(A)C n=1 Tax=Marinimicrobium alkaliphilum TaxID=2202654 RepID=UPI000DB9AF70|nr:copper chaperone PCu(A)C [Marinimicrobium alkaliphilum]